MKRVAKPDHPQRSLFDAINRRDEGIERSYEHAEAATPGWKAEAAALLGEFRATQNGQTFLTEDYVAFALAKGLAEPPDRRAFGGVMQAGLRRGRVVKVGFAPAKTSNLSPKVLWQ